MVVLQTEAQESIIEEAVRAYPNECWGFLLGHEDENSRRIITQVLVAVEPRYYLQAEEYAEKHNLQLLGMYHSHPDHPAIPSIQDRAAAQPLLSYLIISVNGGKPGYIRSWRLNEEGNFEEENNHLLTS
jgi:proteasome lid subunit RPN8/RPN11